MEKLWDQGNILEHENEAIQEDITYLKGMQTDRKASNKGWHKVWMNARHERRSEKACLSGEPVPTDTNLYRNSHQIILI